MKSITGLVGFFLMISTSVMADSGRFGSDDVASPEALTRALHEWASTTVADRLNLDDLFFLMHPDSMAILVEAGNDSSPVQVERRLLREWFTGLDCIDPQGWIETIVDLKVEKQGFLANAWAQYEVRHSADGPIIRKGITNLQLFADGERWWGLGWTDTPIFDH